MAGSTHQSAPAGRENAPGARDGRGRIQDAVGHRDQDELLRKRRCDMGTAVFCMALIIAAMPLRERPVRQPAPAIRPAAFPGDKPPTDIHQRHGTRRWQRSCVGRDRLNRTTGRYVMADKIGNDAQINAHVFGTGRPALRSTVRIFPSQIPGLAPSVGTIGRWTCPNRTNLEQHAHESDPHKCARRARA